MKRPGPLPPRASQTDDADPEEWADEPVAPERRRLADIVPFSRARRGSADPEVAEETDPARAESADVEMSRRPLGVWRAARRRRRAEREEVRRFTARARRRRIMWLCGLGALALVVVGTVGAAYSPLFAVERIEVVGTESLDAEQVAGALDDQMGRPLPLVDDSEIKAELLAFPLIETYSVESSPPHGLVVRIVERTPVAVVASDAGFTTLDAAGVPLATSEQQPEGLPVAEVEGGPSSDAFAAAGQVLRSLPTDLASRVATIRASTPDDVSFDLPDGGGVRVVWGSASDTAEKMSVLEAGFRASPPDTVSTYDVSSADVLVVG